MDQNKPTKNKLSQPHNHKRLEVFPLSPCRD